MTDRLVEILYFDGCPNHEAAHALVRRVLADLGVQADVRLVDVPDLEAAERERFLGSPTVRVDGRDVEPAAAERTDYVYACRVYGVGGATAGVPDEGWLRAALAGEGDAPS